MADLAEDLVKHRLEKELTWRGFAKEIGMSEAGLWKIARGKVKAGELTEYKIRKKLRMELEFQAEQDRQSEQALAESLIEDNHGIEPGSTD
jgi:transcriptional regulator with XRE-family HTH domain